MIGTTVRKYEVEYFCGDVRGHVGHEMLFGSRDFDAIPVFDDDGQHAVEWVGEWEDGRKRGGGRGGGGTGLRKDAEKKWWCR